MARTLSSRPAPSARPTRRQRQHRSAVRQLDRRSLERAGWRTTLEFRENHVRLDTGQLVEVEPFWVAEAERDGEVISVAERSESRAWSTLMAQSRDVDRNVGRDFSDIATA